MNAEADHTRSVRRRAISRNIDAIVELEKEDERKLSKLHKASHLVGWFVGTIQFVILQIVFVVAWAVWNAYGPTRFDPYPFNLLSAVLALEAVAPGLGAVEQTHEPVDLVRFDWPAERTPTEPDDAAPGGRLFGQVRAGSGRATARRRRPSVLLRSCGRRRRRRTRRSRSAP